MHIHALDAYRHRASLVHDLDGRVKLALAVLFIVSTALTPDGAWPAYARSRPTGPGRPTRC
jgi:energy-coupling factor transporter transmembrane protein EcfT